MSLIFVPNALYIEQQLCIGLDVLPAGDRERQMNEHSWTVSPTANAANISGRLLPYKALAHHAGHPGF